MGKIDSIGTYIFEIKESGLGVTKKSSLPQWVARLKAVKKFIDSPEDMKHFELTEPGYVDWSGFDEDIAAFMVLFKSSEEFTKETALLNYEQLQLATGWDGTEFDSLTDGKLVGKQILGRVEENEYEGKTSLQVSWIDSPEASPVHQLKMLDDAAVKGLAAKLKIGKASPKPATPAKPKAVSKPAASPTPAAIAAKPSATAAPAAGGKSGITETTASSAAGSISPAKPSGKPAASPASSPDSTGSSAPKPPKKAAAKPELETPSDETPGLPKEVTKEQAWTYITANKGGNEDTVVEDTWLSACQEVGGERDEESFTNADWAAVRDIIIRDLALSK